MDEFSRSFDCALRGSSLCIYGGCLIDGNVFIWGRGSEEEKLFAYGVVDGWCRWVSEHANQFRWQCVQKLLSWTNIYRDSSNQFASYTIDGGWIGKINLSSDIIKTLNVFS